MDGIAAFAAAKVDNVFGLGLAAVVHAALDRLGDTDFDALHDTTVAELVESLHRAKDRCQALELKVTAVVHRRGLHVGDGHRSTADALAERLGMTPADARRQVEVADALGDMPSLMDAFERGDVDASVAQAAAEAARDLPPAVKDKVDDDIAAAGRSTDKSKVKGRIDQAIHDHDPSLLDDRDTTARRERRLRTWTKNGVGHGSWRTDLATHKTIELMLHVLARSTTTTPDADGPAFGADHDDTPRPVVDDRTLEQRMADALADMANLARAALDDDLPDIGGLPARVWVHTSTDAQTYTEGSDAPTVDGAGAVGPATAEILLCDGEIIPVRYDEHGDDVQVGTVPGGPVTAAQRRRVIARDKTCVGCARRATSCQVHHIRWRKDHGNNALTNLVLVCFDCHRRIHHHGWTVTRGDDGRFTLAKPTDAERRRRAA